MKKHQGPQFVEYFAPVLVALHELGGSGAPTEVIEKVAELCAVPEEKQNETLPSGTLRFNNRVHWARFYLAKEGLVDSSMRGVWSSTELGKKIKLDSASAHSLFLKWSKTFAKNRASKKSRDANESDETAEDLVTVQAGDYRDRLLETIRGLSPSGFERLCQRLLRESGFEQVSVTGKSSDGGIDGVGLLQLNPFVTFKVLFQCKRYQGSVTASQIRDFRGAMSGRADKGIIITTGTFTADAKAEGRRDGVPPIELVDGSKLIDMFEQLELGLIPRKTYDINEKFFSDFSE